MEQQDPIEEKKIDPDAINQQAQDGITEFLEKNPDLINWYNISFNKNTKACRIA